MSETDQFVSHENSEIKSILLLTMNGRYVIKKSSNHKQSVALSRGHPHALCFGGGR
jgi:hypothetical protein